MIQWTPLFETGHADIEHDHRRIIEALNDLEAAIIQGEAASRLLELLRFLETYAREHFQREERLMIDLRCRQYGSNCRAHRQLEEKLDEWKKRSEGEITVPLILEIHRAINEWVPGHILRIDCQLRKLTPPAPNA